MPVQLVICCTDADDALTGLHSRAAISEAVRRAESLKQDLTANAVLFGTSGACMRAGASSCTQSVAQTHGDAA